HLKSAELTSVITPAGEVVEVRGYQELGNRILSGFDPTDQAGRQAAQRQWEQFVGDQLIRKHLAQLFRIFPDSAVRIGEKWKMTTDQHDDFKMKSTTNFVLKEIRDGVA